MIIRLQQEGVIFPDFCKLLLVEKLDQLFRKDVINQEDRRDFFKIKDVTMGQIWNRKKRCFILLKSDFFEDYPVEVDKKIIVDSSEAENQLKEKGIFDKEKFILDCWFNRDSAKKLIEDMEQSFHTINRKGLRVSHYVLSPQKKFKIGYLIKPPTIKSLEKSEFLKDNRIMTHIVDAITNGRDINVGKKAIIFK